MVMVAIALAVKMAGMVLGGLLWFVAEVLLKSPPADEKKGIEE